jgi:cellulose synthase/poly-beta-1,6-N-acetylglucosamine synthase-like glycosyltransferase
MPQTQLFRNLSPDLLLGQLLLASGLLSPEQLSHARSEQERLGVRLGETLVSLGYVSAGQVARAVAHQRQLKLFDPSRAPGSDRPGAEGTPPVADLTAADLLAHHDPLCDNEWLRQRRMIPIRGARGELCIVTDEPPDAALHRELYEHTGQVAELVVATRHAVDRALYELHLERDRDYSTNALLDQDRQNSAYRILTLPQVVVLVAGLGGLVAALVANAAATVVGFVSVLTLLHMAASAYKLYILWLGWRRPADATINADGICLRVAPTTVADALLPVYTILVPLYKEAAVLRQLTDAIQRLDWPKEKLDVRLLLEEDDEETITAARAAQLPAYFTFVYVPNVKPRGKPKACNYGLVHARGAYVVIFDAEDRPEPDQLKKVFATFAEGDPDLGCVQCQLNFYNPDQNVLTRWFTIEYTLWFDLLLPGMQRARAAVPLGGTSNHFRRVVLERLRAWDPYNVTEDADLGVRLAKFGYRTAVIDSTTYEEANPAIGNWIRQRSRWIKGYMQTWLVHMRHPVRLWRELEPRGFASVQFMLGGTCLILLLNPLYWLLTTAWFISRWYGIEMLFPAPVNYLGGLALYVGNFVFIYCSMAAILARQSYSLLRYALISPLYWLLMSVAAWKALGQLITRPHYWEKTQHGLATQGQEPLPEPLPTSAPAAPKRATLPAEIAVLSAD